MVNNIEEIIIDITPIKPIKISVETIESKALPLKDMPRVLETPYFETEARREIQFLSEITRKSKKKA